MRNSFLEDALAVAIAIAIAITGLATVAGIVYRLFF